MIKIPLTQGKFALIDKKDLPRVLKHKWFAVRYDQTWYAKSNVFRNGKDTTIYMHRWIMQPPSGFQIDHKDADGLNNQRSNLRLATVSQNRQNRRLSSVNTSGFKGVSWNKKYGKWEAYIKPNGCRKFLGYFPTKELAAIAYDKAATEHFKEFAWLNA